MSGLVICSSTRSGQSTGKRGFCDGTDTDTHTQHNLETESAQWADSVKNPLEFCFTLGSDKASAFKI